MSAGYRSPGSHAVLRILNSFSLMVRYGMKGSQQRIDMSIPMADHLALRFVVPHVSMPFEPP